MIGKKQKSSELNVRMGRSGSSISLAFCIHDVFCIEHNEVAFRHTIGQNLPFQHGPILPDEPASEVLEVVGSRMGEANQLTINDP